MRGGRRGSHQANRGGEGAFERSMGDLLFGKPVPPCRTCSMYVVQSLAWLFGKPGEWKAADLLTSMETCTPITRVALDCAQVD